MRAVFAVAWARLWHRPTRWLLVVLGVAAATVLPVQSQHRAEVVTADALRYGLAAVDPGDRSLAITRFSLLLTPEQLAPLDTAARAALGRLSALPVRALMLTGRMADRNRVGFHFGAADDLASLVRVVDGRLPASCTPARCEVVQVGEGTLTLEERLGLVVVGHAERIDDFAFTGQFDDGAPILVAAGVAAGAQLEAIAGAQRAYGWIAPLDMDRVTELGVDGYLRLSGEVSNRLYIDRLVLNAPDEVLRAEAARAALSTRRFALVGGAGTVLLLGFAVIGAIGLRRDHAATADLLRRRGARRHHVALLVTLEAGIPVLLAAVLGLAVGLALTSSPAALRGALPAVGLGTLAAGIVVGVALGAGARRERAGEGAAVGRTAWRAVDIVVVTGLVVAALALARGAVTTGVLGEHSDPLVFALPVIVVVGGALLVGRAWPVIVAPLARLSPRRLLATRIGLTAALRSPLRPVATAAFLAAATGVVAFAGAYQATLAQGAVEQAAFEVPLTATVDRGPDLAAPLAVAPVTEFEAAGATVHGVVRSTGTVRTNAAQSITPQLLGVDPAALPLIPHWNHVVGGLSGPSAAALIDAAGSLPGVAVPAGATTLSIPAAGDIADLDVTAWVRQPDGLDRGFPLELPDGALTGDITGSLPVAAPAGSVLFAVTLAEDEFAFTRRQHREGEGGFIAGGLTGSITLGPPAFDGVAAVGGWGDWDSSPAGTVTPGPSTLAVDYGISGEKVVLRGALPVETPVPVVTDPTTAATAVDGLLTLSGSTTEAVPARVVGVVPRFPTTQLLFAVADRRALANALDRRNPGTGSVDELWLSGSPALESFSSLRISTRQSIEDRLRTDPVARGATDLLLAGALAGLAVAVLALVLQVVADRRDEAVSLYAWESDGVAPATLRRSLLARAVAVVVVGVPGGVAIAALLAALTVSLVRVTAVGTEPRPPLSLALSPVWAFGATGAGVVVGLLAGLAVVATALREPLPPRPEEAP